MNWLSDNVLNHLRNVADWPDLNATKYRCLKKIGRGGMATVYLAEDTELERRVALKVLDWSDNDESLADRMRQEARVIASLEHPNIIPIHDVGTLPDGRIFYVMKYVDGQRLDEKVQSATSVHELLRIFQKICEGVAFAHSKNVIHRDLKPENVMVRGYGEVLVMDWGLAKILSTAQTSQTGEWDSREQQPARETANITQHGTVMGTPAYMSPEQRLGQIDEIDGQSDIFALGSILDFVLTHFTPPKNKTGAVPKLFRLLLSGKNQRPAKPLAAIAAKAMSQDKKQRYVNALQLADEVENFLNGAQVTAYDENIIEKFWRWLKRNNFLIFLVLVYILAKLLTLFLTNL